MLHAIRRAGPARPGVPRRLRRCLPAVAVLLGLSLTVPVPPSASERPVFPAAGILPKDETGATRFLRKHPRYDGRGVIVAVFDTGVDPGAAGLQTCPDGRPKIVDLVDGSGSGDVDTSTVRRAEQGRVEGLSGRSLTVDPAWRNPTGEYHLGLKRAFELYPRELVDRLKKERRERWDEKQRLAEAGILREIAEWDRAHPDPTESLLVERKDLELRLEGLRELQKGFDDAGPVFDCVVFHDGQTWRAAIDTDEDGEMADERALANYRLERRYGTFGSEDLLNFAVNIYDDGNLLSVVTDSGDHGTHVAGILAAHVPGRRELDGVAPGAQIVSVKIGDTRIGSTSLGTGEVRGLVSVLENKCDIINMSYGGPTGLPNAGRLIDLYSEIVNEHGVIFVASAGNNGPALSTVGSPGGTTSAIFGIGAVVSPEMMKAGYSMRDTVPENQFTWSSRGPTFDGDPGVAFSAPGGAIAPVPTWLLRNSALMNGTSMSSPNAAGGIALLLSGLKAKGVRPTPFSVRRALANTARPIEGVEPFAIGSGLIQIDRAFERLLAESRRPDADVRYEIGVTRAPGGRGVYLREPEDAARVAEPRVRVEPVFPKSADNRDKVGLQLRLALESTAEWVSAPDHLLLMHGGRSFDMRVDPTGLPEGAHYAEVRAIDLADPAAGPRFRVPVTVIRLAPAEPAGRPLVSGRLSLEPGRLVRRFVALPAGATWADAAVRLSADAKRRLVVHAVQGFPGRPFSELESRNLIWIDPGEEQVRSFKVEGGGTLELVVGQYWSSLGGSDVEYELHVHGLDPSPRRLHMDGPGLAGRVDVAASLRDEGIKPRARLDTLRRELRATPAEVHPLDSRRDLLFGGRQVHQLILTYEFDLDDKQKVRPGLPLTHLDDWDNEFEGALWMLHDRSNRLVGTGVSGREEIEVPKGSYRLRFQVRHDRPDLLEKLRGSAALLDIALDKPVTLSAHRSATGAVTGSDAFGEDVLKKGDRTVVYFAPPGPDDRPKAARAGDRLFGTMSFGPGEGALLGAGARPGGYVVSWEVPPEPAGEEKTAAKKKEPEKTPTASVGDLLRDASVDVLAGLRRDGRREEFETLAGRLLAEHPGHLAVLREKLELADGEGREDDLSAVVDAADAVINAIDADALATHYGRRLPEEDASAREKRKAFEGEKSILVDALSRKARALGEILDRTGSEADRGRFSEAFLSLREWADEKDRAFRTLNVRYDRARGRLGAALETSRKLIDEFPSDRELTEQRLRLLEALGLEHWVEQERKWQLIRYPADTNPF